MVFRCKLKIPLLGIIVRHHSASLVMPNSYPRGGIFNPHLTTIKDSYIQHPERAVYLAVYTCCGWGRFRMFQFVSHLTSRLGYGISLYQFLSIASSRLAHMSVIVALRPVPTSVARLLSIGRRSCFNVKLMV